jgi:RNA polymerase sigma factor (sigma-70 family)
MTSSTALNPFPVDAARLVAMRSGDPGTLRALYAQYAGAVYSFVLRRTGSSADAADIVQDVFFVALSEETWRRFSGEASVLAFLLGIARNRLLHHFRARGHRERAAEQLLLPDHNTDSDSEREAQAFEVESLLKPFVVGLEPRDRDFFLSHLVERPPRRVTAERFHMTEDQVRYLENKLRRRAIAYLKQVGYLDEKGRDPYRLRLARDGKDSAA